MTPTFGGLSPYSGECSSELNTCHSRPEERRARHAIRLRTHCTPAREDPFFHRPLPCLVRRGNVSCRGLDGGEIADAGEWSDIRGGRIRFSGRRGLFHYGQDV